MNLRTSPGRIFAPALALALAAGTASLAAGDPGISDKEIVLGGTHPFSGPASAYGAVGKGAEAYFAYINDKGGVNGRKITYKDLDDSYSPPQAVQQTRQLVEQDKVFAIFNSLGTAVNTAIRPYLNQSQVPQVFISTGATTWARGLTKFPYTIGWIPDYQSESIIYAKNVLKEKPNAKIALIYQNDDYGQDYVAGLKTGLGAKANLIVKEASYEISDPDVSSQISTLKASGADTLFIFATPKFASQSLVAVAQQSWHPTIYLNNVSASESVMKAAIAQGGPAAVQGVITTLYLKDPGDPKLANDPGVQLFKQIMTKYVAGADQTNGLYMSGMGAAYLMVDVLQKLGKDVTRQKLVTAISHIDQPNNPFLLSGISIKTTPTNHFPITQEQLVKWDKSRFVPFGSLIDARPYIQEEAH